MALRLDLQPSPSGTVESPAFSSHVGYYDLDLPSDVRSLEWLQLRDWDSKQIYLRFSTDGAGLEDFSVSISSPGEP
jgi:hypothetical protein